MITEKLFMPKGNETGNAHAVEKSMGYATIRLYVKNAWIKVTRIKAYSLIKSLKIPRIHSA